MSKQCSNRLGVASQPERTPMGPVAARSARTSHERRWFAMGSDIHTLVYAEAAHADTLLDHAQRRIDELEALWTRFRPTSEVSRLNAAGGAPLRCHAETVRLVELMVQAWWVTDGAFDPTLLGSLVGLGYQASRHAPHEYTDLAPGLALVGPTSTHGPAGQMRGRPDAILIDVDNRVVQLPVGTLIDPGGLGKGLAADLVTAELAEMGATGALVSVGGDIAVAGTPSDGQPWCIEVQPDPTCEPAIVQLRSGGVATSSSRLRTWTADGTRRHHLLDPSTGHPTTGSVTGAAVIAGTAATAEAFTKCAFVAGAKTAIETYQKFGLAARIWSDPITTADHPTGQTSPGQTSPGQTSPDQSSPGQSASDQSAFSVLSTPAWSAFTVDGEATSHIAGQPAGQTFGES